MWVSAPFTSCVTVGKIIQKGSVLSCRQSRGSGGTSSVSLNIVKIDCGNPSHLIEHPAQCQECIPSNFQLTPTDIDYDFCRKPSQQPCKLTSSFEGEKTWALEVFVSSPRLYNQAMVMSALKARHPQSQFNADLPHHGNLQDYVVFCLCNVHSLKAFSTIFKPGAFTVGAQNIFKNAFPGRAR